MKIARWFIAATFVASSLFTGVGAAWSTTPISPIMPNQQFVGLINGKAANATINMACFGPIRPGQLGHPFGNQWAEVLNVSGVQPLGYTGSLGTSIVANFPGPPTAVPEQIVFHYYGLQAQIPTSFYLPCSGSAPVVFTPEPTSPTARSFTVNVNFVGQP